MKAKNRRAKDNRRTFPLVLKWSAICEGILTLVNLNNMSSWTAITKCAEFCMPIAANLEQPLAETSSNPIKSTFNARTISI